MTVRVTIDEQALQQVAHEAAAKALSLDAPRVQAGLDRLLGSYVAVIRSELRTVFDSGPVKVDSVDAIAIALAAGTRVRLDPRTGSFETDD